MNVVTEQLKKIKESLATGKKVTIGPTGTVKIGDQDNPGAKIEIPPGKLATIVL